MITPIQRMKIVNMADNIIKMTPNIDSKNLEIAFVFDGNEEANYLKEVTADIIKALKMHSEIYRNVRTNTIFWKNDANIIKEVTPMPMLQMGRYFDEKYQSASGEDILQEQTWDEITRQLKLFYARAKLVILIGKGDYEIKDEKQVKENFAPFLKRKMLIVTNNDIKKYT